MDINLQTKFNIGDRVGFDYFWYMRRFNDREWEQAVHLSPNYDYKNDRELLHKEYYGKIQEIRLVYKSDTEGGYRNSIDFSWHYVVYVEGDVCRTFEVEEREIFSRNVQELSAYSTEELRNEIDRRRPSCEDCKWFNPYGPCDHDTGVGRPIEECFTKKDE